MDRVRLDMALEQRGLLPSRSRARDAILRGTVEVNGVPARKPHQLVGGSDVIALADPAQHYVSRSALKLAAGLDAAAVEVADRVCLDIGASTGGFTQVMLERGARVVYAVDVGHGQLHESLRLHPRVISREGVNGRDLDRTMIPDPIDILVCDVSFVSVLKVLAQPLALCRKDATAVILIKPQFEAGPEHVGKGGIVTNSEAVVGAENGVRGFFAENGWKHLVSLPSPILGGDGNHELVAAFRRVP